MHKCRAPERCEGKGELIFVKGHFCSDASWPMFAKHRLLNFVSSCFLSLRWFRCLGVSHQTIVIFSRLVGCTFYLDIESNDLKWKGIFASLAPPGKRQGGQLPLLPSCSGVPAWAASVIAVFVNMLPSEDLSYAGLAEKTKSTIEELIHWLC